MANLLWLSFLVACVVVTLLSPFAAAQLRTGYYSSICPNLETIIQSSVKQSRAQNVISGPAALRLFFHDCAVGGCDASIMIVNSSGDDERHHPDDQSLKQPGFQTILDAKAAVDNDPQCRNKVSCADILALAARESVFQSGGPYYQVELGRYDGRISTTNSVVLPHVDFNLDNLNAYFSNLGLSQTDMIALSGGHTLGAADCVFFQSRIGNGTDPTMDSTFAAQLRNTCAGQSFAFLDDTPAGFGNSYFKNLQAGRGLLGSDQVLYTDLRSRGTVNYYADHEDTFYYDFANAMIRLGRVGVKTAANGEIRRDCLTPN
ncbi:unnamed protein product [Alopecurus aequalis]